MLSLFLLNQVFDFIPFSFHYQPSSLVRYERIFGQDLILVAMPSLSPEAIIALLALVVALPPAMIILWGWWRRCSTRAATGGRRIPDSEGMLGAGMLLVQDNTMNRSAHRSSSQKRSWPLQTDRSMYCLCRQQPAEAQPAENCF